MGRRSKLVFLPIDRQDRFDDGRITSLVWNAIVHEEKAMQGKKIGSSSSQRWLFWLGLALLSPQEHSLPGVK
jgi:hypothetical protein